MDLFKSIQTRLSVRKFKTDIPPYEDIEKIIDAARLAPSSTNAQMWHFIAIYNNDIKYEIKKAVSNKYDEIKNWEETKGQESRIEQYKQFSTFFTDAPVVIAVLMEPTTSPIQDLLIKRGLSHKEVERHRPHPDLLSIGAAIENLSLAAHSMGYGTCWLTAPLCAYKEIEEILHFKENFHLVSLLCLGTPENPDTPLKEKKKLAEILTIIK